MTRAYLCPVWQYSDYASLLCLDCTNKSLRRASCSLSSQYLTTHLPNIYSALSTEVQRFPTTDHVWVHLAACVQNGWFGWAEQGPNWAFALTSTASKAEWLHLCWSPRHIYIYIYIQYQPSFPESCTPIHSFTLKLTKTRHSSASNGCAHIGKKTHARLVHVLQYHSPHPALTHARTHVWKRIVHLTDNSIVIVSLEW